MSEEVPAPATGPDGVRRETPYLHSWNEEEKLNYAEDSNFDRDTFNQQNGSPDYTTFKAEDLKRAVESIDAEKNPIPKAIEMPPDLKDRIDREVVNDIDKRQQLNQYSQSRMRTTNINSAPSQTVTWGGLEGSNTARGAEEITQRAAQIAQKDLDSIDQK
jgi:hypothetical protein